MCGCGFNSTSKQGIVIANVDSKHCKVIKKIWKCIKQLSSNLLHCNYQRIPIGQYRKNKNSENMVK